MKLRINGSKIDMTPSLKKYIELKIAPLGKFVKRFERGGESEMYFEIARSTKPTKHGPAFYAEATLELPKKALRAQCYESDVRAAIDAVKDKLRIEIGKYKETFLGKAVARGRMRVRKI